MSDSEFQVGNTKITQHVLCQSIQSAEVGLYTEEIEEDVKRNNTIN